MLWVRKYWVAAIVVAMVLVHAVIIGYVRSQITRLKSLKSSTVTVGTFRFQTTQDPSTIYYLHVHALINSRDRLEVEDLVQRHHIELQALVEQNLRQVAPHWLQDPEHKELRQRLKEIISQELSISSIDQILVTDYLKVPASAPLASLSPGPAIASMRAETAGPP